MDEVSIVIRNKNESRFIGYAIQSCLDFFNNPEIIVVDDNSNDDSDKVISLFDRADIKIFNLKNRYTPGYSINYGISKCSNEICLVLSAHCQVTKMNLSYIKKSLETNRAVFGNQIPIYCGKRISKRYIWSHFGPKEKLNLYSKIENRNFLHNAFCFYSKSFLMDNPFDEQLSGKEDRYWAIEIAKNGYNYLYTPKIEVNHFWTPRGATWRGLG